MRLSLRTRLLLVALGAAVAGLLVVDVSTYVLVNRAQLDLVDQELDRAHIPIERAANGALVDLGEETRADRDTTEEGSLIDTVRDLAPEFYVEFRPADGKPPIVAPLRRPGQDDVTLLGANLPAPRRAGLSTYRTIRTEGDTELRARISREEDGGVLVIARPIESVVHTRSVLFAVLATASAGAVLAVLVVGVWLVRIGLRPLIDVERSAARITDDNIAERVPGADPATEVGRLAGAINSMLDRLQGAFDQRDRDLTTLQESEARMRRFVADASHELRTPIAATAAYAELFERGAKDRPQDLERAMTGIRSETGRMAVLVNDLLLLARLDEGRPLDRAPVDLADLALEAVDSARAVDPSHPVKLRIAEVVVVPGDRVRLRQVVDNLLGNVRTHTPPGTACTVEVDRVGNAAVLRVRDEGPGMEADDAALAFDRFHRADVSRTRASGGAGLGLSIVAALIESHGGSVSLDSAPGAGTTVAVTLPLDDATEATE